MAGSGKNNSSKRRIFKRIMLLCYLISAVTVGIFAFAMITFEKASIRGNLETQATELATSVASGIVGDLADTSAVKDYCAKVLSEETVLDYLVISESASGRSIVNTVGVQREAELDGVWTSIPTANNFGDITPSPLGSRGKSFHYAQAFPKTAGTEWDLLHVGLSLDSYNRAMGTLYQITGIAAGVAFLIGTLVSWLFTRRFTQPIYALQKHAHRIAGGGSTERAEINTGDEIEDLAESINSMVASLEQSKQTIRDSLAQQASLREKDVLLREIHHRVKNNMQILSSLIRLQTRRAESKELREVLAESEARIRSMGLLHEKLYQSDSVSSIEVEGYLRSLTNELLRLNTRKKVDLKLVVHGIQMGLDTALPCGLIVTELVSNSMKYAFPDDRAGTILVTVSKDAEGEYSLIVWDNGIGVPADFDISKAKSLGLRLVTMLSAQLNGTLHVSGQRGTRVEIRFKESEYTTRY